MEPTLYGVLVTNTAFGAVNVNLCGPYGLPEANQVAADFAASSPQITCRVVELVPVAEGA